MCTCVFVCLYVSAYGSACLFACMCACIFVYVCVSMCLCMCGTHILRGEEAGGWGLDPNLQPLLIRMGDAES